MAFKDLREYLQKLEQDNDLARIDQEMDSKFEVSGLTLAAYLKGKRQDQPALFFLKIKGSEWGMVTNLLGSNRRLALVFGLESEELFSGLCERYQRMVPPKLVASAPCKENVLVGEKVDLGMVPIIWWNEYDAGPYITAGNVITKDPVTGRHNVGRYRLQRKGKDELGVFISERQHIGRHYRLAQDKGLKALDVAVALGCDPSLEVASETSIPYDWEEYAWSAGNLDVPEPMEVIRGESVDLLVPARAEAIIEGKINLGEYEPEGPIGEFTGYYSGVYENPVLHVTAITFRNRPVIRGIHMANAPGENLMVSQMVNSVVLYQEVKRHVPEITGVRQLWGWHAVVAQVARGKKYMGLARRVADSIWATGMGSFCKHIIVVDDDVDLDNLSQVFWAMTVRTQAEDDVVVYRNCPGFGIDPSEKEINIRSMGRSGVSRVTSRLLWDATESLMLSPDIRVIEAPPGFERLRQYYETISGKGGKR